ncbi:MAG: L,D-transpeptidase [bacterium]|nr:L,D-transpeptidase [bacterium]
MYTLKRQNDLEKVFPESWIEILRFNRIDRVHIYKGYKVKIPLNSENFHYNPLPMALKKYRLVPKVIVVDLSKQFLGAYQYGRLKFSFPISSGKEGFATPTGLFYIYNFEKNKRSSRYFINNSTRPYPMDWALQLSRSEKKDTNFFIHGRDLDGKPASHGCIGLYDEEMQKKYYGYPKKPALMDAKTLYMWIVATDKKKMGRINGPPVLVKILGKASR